MYWLCNQWLLTSIILFSGILCNGMLACCLMLSNVPGETFFVYLITRQWLRFLDSVRVSAVKSSHSPLNQTQSDVEWTVSKFDYTHRVVV